MPQRMSIVWFLHEPCLDQPYHGAKKERKIKQKLTDTQRFKRLKECKVKIKDTKKIELIDEELLRMKSGKKQKRRQINGIDYIYKKNPRYQHIVTATTKRLETEKKEHQEALSIINSPQWEFS